jgi:D-alanyl-D-alanine carboxypeptidase (penicillin-binding protein 5/6)
MSIEDLLYGLMLPSGNDAALVLAENLGAVLYFDKTGNK